MLFSPLESLKKIELYRHQLKPHNWVQGSLHLLVSPFSSPLIMTIVNIVFISIIMAKDQLFSYDEWFKQGMELSGLMFSLFAINSFLSFLYTLLIVHPLAACYRFKTHNSSFGAVSLLLCFIGILVWVALFTLQPEMVRQNISWYYGGAMWLAISFINPFSYKVFNDMYCRDVDGKIVYFNKN